MRALRAVAAGLIGIGTLVAVVPPASAATIGSTFTADNESWTTLEFPAAHNASAPASQPAAWDGADGVPPGALRVGDVYGETGVGAPAAYLGDRSAWVGGTLAYDIVVRFSDGAAYGEAVLRGASTSLFYSPASSPTVGALEHRNIPLTASAWKVGNVNGTTATNADLLAVLGDLQGIYLRTEWRTGPDDTTIDNVAFTSPAGAATVAFNNATTNVSESSTTVQLQVRRTGDLTGAASVDWATTDGSATAGLDYETGAGTLNWNAGTGGNRTITLTLHPDAIDEARETITVELSNAVGAGLGTPATAEVRIADDDDPPTVSITTADKTVDEGRSATYTVVLSGASSRKITVPVSLVDGTTSPGDASANKTKLSFPAGTTSTTVRVTAATDALVEGNESLTLTLGMPTNATLGTPSTRQFTIRNV